VTSTNHVLTGAVIALVIKQPAIAIPVAFLSHFVLDVLPHFGIYEDDVVKRNANRLFRTVLSIDILLLITALSVVPWLVGQDVGVWLVFSCMVAAVLPDAAWVPMFVREIKTKQWRPSHNHFINFHRSIQWFEKPQGLAVELLWIIMLILILVKRS
jgi:hypothetical protein